MEVDSVDFNVKRADVVIVMKTEICSMLLRSNPHRAQGGFRGNMDRFIFKLAIAVYVLPFSHIGTPVLYMELPGGVSQPEPCPDLDLLSFSNMNLSPDPKYWKSYFGHISAIISLYHNPNLEFGRHS